MTTGERIRHIRNERGISQKQLSEMCGLSEPAIRNYELGNRKPSAQILDKIAAALAVTAAELVLPELLDIIALFGYNGIGQESCPRCLITHLIVGRFAAWIKERVFLSLGIPPPELKSGCKSNQQNAGVTRHFVLHIAHFLFQA